MPESSGDAGEVGWGAVVGQLLLLPPLQEPGGEVSSVEVSRCCRRVAPLRSDSGGDGTVSGNGWLLLGCSRTAGGGNCAEEQSGVEADRGQGRKGAVNGGPGGRGGDPELDEGEVE